jgi:diguanylate cyclase (GGDEF)-like protein/putative nucleotidyltransferase with HDIG domain
MSLRLKVIIAVLIALAASAALIHEVSQWILMSEIERIEVTQMQREVSVAQKAFDRELSELDTRVFDYSAWDDSYGFMANPTQGYLDSNVPDNLYQSFGINVLAFVRSDGTIAFGRLFDLDKGTGAELPAGLQSLWSPDGPLLASAAAGGHLSGIVNTSVGTLLVACRPILTSAEMGPARGALVMGRLLNGSLLNHLDSETQLNLTAAVVDPFSSAGGGSNVGAKPASAGSTVVEAADANTIEGNATIDDIYGRPALLLHVEDQRLTYEQGKRAIAQYLLIVIMIVVCLGIALNLALSQWILAPLRKLVGQVKGLALPGKGAMGRLDVGHGAEFKTLGLEINHLLEELENAHNEISQLYGLAREQADRDLLTGLLSRRAVFDQLERRLGAARELGGKLAILMIDVDGFKMFNDAHGHLAGDEVLRIVGEALSACTREGDLIGRYGGDEFLAILPNTDAAGAVSQAERLLATTETLAWMAPDGTDVPVSLSIGVSAFPGHASELNELLAYADANLYCVKQHGRGTVSVDGSTDQTGAGNYGFGMLDSLITALSEKDQYTRTHAEDVASHAVRIAEALGLDGRMIRAIRIAGLLHDVGKTGIPASLLLRPGQLTPEEAALMQKHVEIGVALIRDVPELDEVLEAVRTHHEHLNGTGYPNGLKGDQIPLGGRILGVADRYSAMTSFRPYRRARTGEEAEAELRTMAGSELDAHLVEVFLCVLHPAAESARSPQAGSATSDVRPGWLAGQGAS